MKKILVAILFAFSVSAVCAQEGVTFWDNSNPNQKWVFGPRVGLNVAKTFDESMKSQGSRYKSKMGYNLGIEVDYAIFKSLSINSGLFFTTKGYRYEAYFKGNNGDGSSIIKFGLNYLQLPVYASYRLNFASNSQLQVNFGPYFAYGVGGKHKVETRNYDTDSYESIEANAFRLADRFDFGLGVGAGYTFSRIYLGLSYEFGLSDISKDDRYEIRNRNLNISIGYNF